MKLSITIVNLNAEVSRVNESLKASPAGKSYNWLDCSNELNKINGANSQVFVPSKSGIYAVEVTDQQCIDTSDCYFFQHAGIDETAHAIIDVYPIPASQSFVIDLNGAQGSYFFYDPIGKLINSGVIYDRIEPNVYGYSQGIYHLKIDLNGDAYHINILVAY